MISFDLLFLYNIKICLSRNIFNSTMINTCQMLLFGNISVFNDEIWTRGKHEFVDSDFIRAIWPFICKIPILDVHI